MPYCTKCGEFVSETSRFCGNCAELVRKGKDGMDEGKKPPSPEYPMNWYNFLIYFGLFAVALIHIWDGFSYITGSYLGKAKGVFYEFLPGWRLIDISAGIFYIIMGVRAFMVRQKLAEFEEEGPGAYISYLTQYLIGSVVHFILILLLIEDYGNPLLKELMSGLTTAFLFIIALGIGEIMANKAYFEKRKRLFIY